MPTIPTEQAPPLTDLSEAKSIAPVEDPGLAESMALLTKLIPDESDAAPSAPEDEQPEGDELPPDGEPQATEGEESPEPVEAEEEPDELQEVYDTLQEDGWRLSELKGLSKAALIRMGKAAAKRQSGVKEKFDKHSAEIGNLKQQLEAKGKSEAELGKESPGQPASANLAEVAKRFSQATGIEERDAEPILAALGTAYTQPLRQQLGEAQAIIQQMSAAVGDVVFDSVRNELRETFPKLNTPEGVAEVKKHSKRLNPEAYSDLGYRDRVKAMVQDAYGLAFKAEAAPIKEPKRAPKRNQPSLPGKQTPTKGYDDFTESMRLLEKLEKEAGIPQ